VSMHPKVTSLIVLMAVLGSGAYLYGRKITLGASAISRHYVKAMYSAPLSLDPAQMDDTASLVASNLIYDGLLAFSSNLDLQGALAESWDTSRDGKTLHFNLRKNAKFQNDEPVTAQDVVHSLKRVLAPGSKVYSYYDCIVGADSFHEGKSEQVSGLKAIGKDQVEISLKYPFPPFLSVLAGATARVLPRESDDPDFFKFPIGSGPFRFVKTVKAANRVDTILERFDGYYGERPKIEEMTLRAVDESEAIKEAESGEIQDLANFPLSGTEAVFSSGKEVRAPVAATWIIGLNTRLPPFNDVNFRRAFRDSLDTDAFRRRFHPGAVPANGYIPPGLPGFQWAYRGIINRVTKPRHLSHQRIRIAIPKELENSDEMKRFLEQSFRSQGWNVEIVQMQWDKLMQGYSDKKLQAFLVSMNMDYPDTEFLVRNFESTNPDNFSGLRDKVVDDLIRTARATQDRVLRQKIYVALVERLHDEAVTIDLFHPRGHYWIADCVKGFQPDILAESISTTVQFI
jgi:ABC-type transport system substrate-binding protein